MNTKSERPRDVQRYARRATECVASGKSGFRTKRKAMRAAQVTQELQEKRLHVYRCASCGKWHMSRQGPRSEAMK